MHNSGQIIKLIVLAGVTIVIIVAALYGMFFIAGKSKDTAENTKFEVYERFASRYYSLLLSYDGICFDMKPSPSATCEESSDAYRVYERLDNGTYNCVDIRGYQGVVPSIPKDSLSCR